MIGEKDRARIDTTLEYLDYNSNLELMRFDESEANGGKRRRRPDQQETPILPFWRRRQKPNVIESSVSSDIHYYHEFAY